MALADDIQGLPASLELGEEGHIGDHEVIHAGLKDHETRITTVEQNGGGGPGVSLTEDPDNPGLYLIGA